MWSSFCGLAPGLASERAGGREREPWSETDPGRPLGWAEEEDDEKGTFYNSVVVRRAVGDAVEFIFKPTE